MITRRVKPKECYVGNEDQFQASAMALVASIAVTQGVAWEAITHIPSGAVFSGDARRRAIQGNRLKKQGWKAGYPDIMVFALVENRELADSISGYNMGLGIELKVWPNKASPEQLKVHAVLEKAGWVVKVCYGLEDVRVALCEYFRIK